jgi:hypothetical protein
MEDFFMNRRPWKRLAVLRAARRRGTELPPPPSEERLEPIPPLEPPDDDREFVIAWLSGIRTRPEAA